MSDVVDREAQAQLVQQIKALPEADWREALEEFEEIYGRSRAESLRKEIETQIAVDAGRLMGWDGEQFTNLSPEKLAAWKRAYPGVAIDREVAKATAYLQANPGAVKSRYERFMTNWLNKELSRSVRTRRREGKVSMSQLHIMFLQQHDATRICPANELIEHLKRSPVGMRYVVDWLFDRMINIWGSAFSSKWAGLDVAQMKNEWCSDLHKLTIDEIKTGARRIKEECTFPVSRPEFIQLCRPTQSIETTFMQCASLAARHLHDHATPWPGAVEYWTAQRFGMAALAQSTWVAAKAQFTGIYHDCLTQQEEGVLPALPPAVPRIVGPAEKVRTDAGSAALAHARALLKGKGMQQSHGGRM